MKIITHSHHVEVLTYSRVFSRSAEKMTSGFSFDCDEHGNIDESKLQPCAVNSLRQCLMGSMDGETLYDLGVQKYETSRFMAAVGKCECGRKVYLSSFTNTCDCGADYNSGGQRLAPREQWGEETGEHWTDCL